MSTSLSFAIAWLHYLKQIYLFLIWKMDNNKTNLPYMTTVKIN